MESGHAVVQDLKIDLEVNDDLEEGLGVDVTGGNDFRWICCQLVRFLRNGRYDGVSYRSGPVEP